jgi:two-component system cell cycle sensor histidine kinase PleC
MTQAKRGGKPKVLYVDDERPNLIAFRALLRDTYDVLIAENTADAHALLQSQDIPLIVSDQRMPDQSGVEFLERVAIEYPDTMRMILTGYADIDAVVAAVNLGKIYYYFRKPWREAEVRLTLRNALESCLGRRALIESERQFRSTFEQAGIGMAHLAVADGSVLRANSRLQSLLGRDEAELRRAPFTHWIDQVSAGDLRSISESQVAGFSQEVSIASAAGMRVCQVSLSLTHDLLGGSGYVLALVGDRTEQRHAERELADLHERLYSAEKGRASAAEELVQRQRDFVMAVSHELRTPLTSILGYAELLQARWSHLTDQQRLDQISRVVRAAGRQQRLVEDLLLVSRLGNEPILVDCRPVLLAPLVREAADEASGFYAGQRVSLDGALDISIYADPNRVVQILANVIDNAAKYSPDDGSISISWQEEGALVAIRVRDSSPGVPLEGRKRLFTRFGRVAGSRMRAGRVGTGLGLFLSRELAMAMGGNIDLEETGPEGSTFRLRLPIASDPPDEAAARGS